MLLVSLTTKLCDVSKAYSVLFFEFHIGFWNLTLTFAFETKYHLCLKHVLY